MKIIFPFIEDNCSFTKMKKMVIKKKSNAGRKTKPEGEKVAMVPLYAKKKHHVALKEKFQPLITKAESKLDKEVEDGVS